MFNFCVHQFKTESWGQVNISSVLRHFAGILFKKLDTDYLLSLLTISYSASHATADGGANYGRKTSQNGQVSLSVKHIVSFVKLAY